MRALSIFAFAFVWLSAVVAVQPAHAVLEIDITSGRAEPLRIAIPAFPTQGAQAGLGEQISGVVAADLERSGLYRLVDRDAYIQSATELVDATPRFADWRLINAQALVSGAVQPADGGRVAVEFRLWDVFGEEQMVGRRITGDPAQWRRIAHQIADAIYKRMTGVPGYFDTRIAYIAETGPKTQRTKRVAIMDQDGANHSFLTDGADLVLTPRFDLSGENVAYMAYRGLPPKVYSQPLSGGQERLLGDFPGMTFAPRYAPDGRTVAMSLAERGNSDIFLLDLQSGQQRRLTSDPGIDTSPSFSPDGSRIVFNSDRAGEQELYVMNADGSNQQRISFGDGRYATPVWSPDGELIAFTLIKDGYFHIGVMRPDGSDERLLTRSYADEAPSWAPNGQTVIFTRQRYGGDRSRLYSIDISGYNEREVPTPLDASDPDWSPSLQ